MSKLWLHPLKCVDFFPASSRVIEVLFWFYQTSVYYLLWQISFGLEFRPEMHPFLTLWVVALFLKRGHSKVSVIASYSCSTSSLHSDWAATPVSSKTAGPLKSADLFFSFSAVICHIHIGVYWPQALRRNSIWEKLPHRLLGFLTVRLPHNLQLFQQLGTLILYFLSPEFQPTLLLGLHLPALH